MSGELINSNLRIGLVGYGEVGKILARALREKGTGWVGAWDVVFRDSYEYADRIIAAQESARARERSGRRS